MAVFAPMPNANVATPAAVKPGCRTSERIARRRSRRSVSMSRNGSAGEIGRRSVVAEGDDGLDLRGAPGRNHALDQCDRALQYRNSDERRRITAFHAVQHATEAATHRERRGDADEEPDSDETHAAAEHEHE